MLGCDRQPVVAADRERVCVWARLRVHGCVCVRARVWPRVCTRIDGFVSVCVQVLSVHVCVFEEGFSEGGGGEQGMCIRACVRAFV